MAERSALQFWGMRLLYPLMALVILFVALLPTGLLPSRVAGPDVLTALTLAWAGRRPEHLPALSVAAVMLLADFLLQRPPGLWALLVLLAVEWLKSQDRRLRDSTFFDELLTVGLLLLTITLIYRAVLALLIVAPGALPLAAMQYAGTLAIYPFVAGALYLGLGVRRSLPRGI